MSDPVADILEHYGTKGMKWGIRKDLHGGGKRTKVKKIMKLDKQFERRGQSDILAMQVYNKAAKAVQPEVDRINNKPKYKNKDFTKESPLRQAYYKEHKDAMIKALEDSAKSFGTNASGTRRFTIYERPGGEGWDLTTTNVEHAQGTSMFIKVNKNEKGYIISLEFPEQQLSHSIVDDILHYGVKGMKWGKRKSSSKEKTTYKKAPRTLSDADLKKRIARLENEKRYNELNKKHISAGRAATTEILATSGKQIAKSVAVGVGTVLVKAIIADKFGPQYSDAIRIKK